MTILDDEKKMKVFDTQGMMQSIQDLPAQIETCWQQISKFSFPTHYINAKNIVILGMGGSAVGGGLIASLALGKSKIPIYVHRDYDLPNFVSSDTLVIGVSYSGNTEETISGFERAGKITNKLVGISTGGNLASLCRKYQCPMFEINYGSQPRAALGYLLIAILGIFNKLGILNCSTSNIEQVVNSMKTLETKIQRGVPLTQNQAKQLAYRLEDKIPIIVGSGILSEVARRWKTQINENSKHAAYFEFLPELNHNSVMGFDNPQKLSDKIFVIMLQSKFDHPRVKIRQQVSLQIIQQRKIQYETVFFNNALEELEEMMLTIFLGDYVSYYLSVLHGVDPTDIAAINYLKDRLSASK